MGSNGSGEPPDAAEWHVMSIPLWGVLPRRADLNGDKQPHPNQACHYVPRPKRVVVANTRPSPEGARASLSRKGREVNLGRTQAGPVNSLCKID